MTGTRLFPAAVSPVVVQPGTREAKRPVLSDIAIAQAATARPIGEIATKLGILPAELVPYGHTKA